MYRDSYQTSVTQWQRKSVKLKLKKETKHLTECLRWKIEDLIKNFLLAITQEWLFLV